ncbi:MAG: hypothetical protein IJO20_00415 [Ruminococcus sp.]|nr:hypothetical protein [Ruminococcus sp.]
MKKFVCFILVLILVLSIAVTPAFAVFSDDAVRIYRKKFTDKYVKPYDAADGYYFYFEQYYSYDDNGDIDWVLIYAGDMSYTSGKVKKVVGNRLFLADESSSPFVFKYAVYDVKEDKFYDLEDNLCAKYEDLEKALRYEKAGIPIGDADMDKSLSVLDAAEIQMVLVGKHEFNSKDELGDYTDLGGNLGYISDFDRDGEISVLDASGIQMYLLTVEDDFEPTEPTDPDGMM